MSWALARASVSPSFSKDLSSSSIAPRLPCRLYTSRRIYSSSTSSAQAAGFCMAHSSVSVAKLGDISPAIDDFSSTAIIMEPPHKTGHDVLLYFLPGAFTAPTDYIALLTRVQSSCISFRLWVSIIDPGNAVVRPAMVDASFDGVIERVKLLGFTTGPIIFGGHSWGAWEARAVAVKRSHAFIQLGSCFHSNPDNLVQYPKPVLTLSGEVDGQITLAAIAKHAGEVHAVKDELGEFFVNAIKPVVIVPGMNHAQFSHGIPNKQRGDLDAEISDEQARDICASVISSFITVHACDLSDEAFSAGIAILKEAVGQTYELYKVFWDAIDQPGRDVKKMQLELAAVPSLTEHNVGIVQHEYKDNFIYSKPFIDRSCQKIVVNTFLSSIGRYNLLSNIWVKFKSRESVCVSFGGGQMAEPQFIGAYFNERTFVHALRLVQEPARKKYEEHGKKLRFLKDVVTSSAQEWIDSDLVMKPADDGTSFVDVQSTAIITAVHGVPERFAGMHYLKLLTIARALSWIYVDSFRP